MLVTFYCQPLPTEAEFTEGEASGAGYIPITLSMHLRPSQCLSAEQFSLQVKTRRNPFLILPLGMAVIVSAMPGNALAFETQIAEARNTSLVAPVAISRPNIGFIGDAHLWASVPESTANAVVAISSPVTEAGTRRAPVVPPVAAPEPVKVAIAAPVAPAAPQEAPATPASSTPGGAILTLEGEASYYSRAGCLGCSPALRMANGQPLDDSRLTMAIGAHLKHLVGRQARVTSLATGKSTMVQITDTGGFYKAKYGNRVADLTIATKQAIGMAGGVGQVRVEVF